MSTTLLAKHYIGICKAFQGVKVTVDALSNTQFAMMVPRIQEHSK